MDAQDETRSFPATVWSMLRLREGPNAPFEGQRGFDGSTALHVWSKNSILVEVEPAAAALFLNQTDCDDVTFKLHLLPGSPSSPSETIGYSRPLRRVNRSSTVAAATASGTTTEEPSAGGTSEHPRSAARLNATLSLPVVQRIEPLRLQATAEYCEKTESREVFVKPHRLRIRRYDLLDNFMVFEHAQQPRLRPGFATSITWGIRFGPCEGGFKAQLFKCIPRGIWNFLDPAAGGHVAVASFAPQQNTVEVGSGVTVSFFGGVLSFGYGSNLTTS